MTNDGDLAHRLTHPSYGVDKEYLVEVDGDPHRGVVRRLREGVELEDGITAPAKVAVLGDHLLRITIHEGRHRPIRRMCEAVGDRKRVVEGKRVSVRVDLGGGR